MLALGNWPAFLIDMSKGAITVLAAADPVSSYACIASPFFALDQHGCGGGGAKARIQKADSKMGSSAEVETNTPFN